MESHTEDAWSVTASLLTPLNKINLSHWMPLLFNVPFLFTEVLQTLIYNCNLSFCTQFKTPKLIHSVYVRAYSCLYMVGRGSKYGRNKRVALSFNDYLIS